MTRYFRCSLLACLLLVADGAMSFAADPTYWADVRPILRKNCTVCHNERKLDEPEVSAGLALHTLDAIRKGGKVPVLKAGKPDDSLLVSLLTEKNTKRRMPLDADPLTVEQIATLRKWVELGAPEGTKPVEVAAVVRPVNRRKLDVAFSMKPTTGKLGVVELSLPIGPLPPVAAVAFSPDGKWLASGVYGRVTIWDAETAKPVRTITNVLAAVHDLKFSPDGRMLAVAGGQPSARGDLRLFSVADGQLLHNLGGHADVVSGVAFSPDGTKIASASFDKTVRLWDAKTGALIHTFAGHSDFVYAVAFSPKGDWYATASKDRTGRIVDAKTGKGRFTLSGMEQEVMAVAVRPDGLQIVTSGFEPQLHWWDATTGERLKKQGGHDIAVHELAFDTSGKIAISAGADKTVRVWNAQTSSPSRTILTGSIAYAVATDPAGKRVAAGCADGLVKIYDSTTGRHGITLWAGDADTWLSVSPDGAYLGAEATIAAAKWSIAGKPTLDTKLFVNLKSAEAVAKAIRGER